MAVAAAATTSFACVVEDVVLNSAPIHWIERSIAAVLSRAQTRQIQCRALLEEKSKIIKPKYSIIENSRAHTHTNAHCVGHT